MHNEDYKQGATDCQNGLQAKLNQSNWYYSGYSNQYAKEQQLTEATKNVR